MATLRFAGIGSYSCPWYLDTNDLILQAMGHAQGVTDFIDEAWIEFVVQLNKRLRLIDRLNCYSDFKSLMKYLREDRTMSSLGGLRIELCAFSNVVGGLHKIDDSMCISTREKVRSSETAPKEVERRNSRQVSLDRESVAGGDVVRLSLFSDHDLARIHSGDSSTSSALKLHEFPVHPSESEPPTQTPFSAVQSVLFRGAPTTADVGGDRMDDTVKATAAPSTVLGKVITVDDTVSDYEYLCRLVAYGRMCPGVRISLAGSSPLEPIHAEDDEDGELDEDDEKGEEVSTAGSQQHVASTASSQRSAEMDRYFHIVEKADSVLSPLSGSPASSVDRIVSPTISGTVPTMPKRASGLPAAFRPSEAPGPPSAYLYPVSVCSLGSSGDSAICAGDAFQLSRDRASVRSSVDSIRKDESRGSEASNPPQRTDTATVPAGNRYARAAVTVAGFVFQMSYSLLRLLLGSNALPHGPPSLLPTLSYSLLFFSSIDTMLTLAVLVLLWCGGDATTCDNHMYVILPLSLWPGALLFAPLTGIVAILLGPNALYAKVYAGWSRLAALSNITLITMFATSKGLPSYTVYFIIAMSASRLYQCLVVDIYIAHIESMRFSRGWDGLMSSLYAANDKKYHMTDK